MAPSISLIAKHAANRLALERKRGLRGAKWGTMPARERERDRERERAPFAFALGKKRQQRAVKSVEIRVEGLVICIYVSYKLYVNV